MEAYKSYWKVLEAYKSFLTVLEAYAMGNHLEAIGNAKKA